MVEKSLEAAKYLREKKIKARVINLHTPKPIDKPAIIKAARETGAVLTVEEHSIAGGMGSAVAEVLAENCPVPMKFMGLDDRFGVSGTPEELYEYFGLTEKYIVKEAEELFKKKIR
jgi:transketolase